MRASLAICFSMASLLGVSACATHPAPAPVSTAEQRAERRDERRDRKFDNRSDWDKLGERMVDGRMDRDVIEVGARDGRFRRLMLVVEQSAVEVYDVRVVFGDGTDFSPNTRLVFGKDTSSNEIDLPGGERIISRVEFKYGNLPGGGRAQVELWAR